MGKGKVLVVPRQDLPDSWLPHEGALRSTWGEVKEVISTAGTLWLERSQAEYDHAYKQLIAYVRLRDSQGSYAVYKRQGSEQRLHGLWSVGLGGHVDEGDCSAADDSDAAKALERAAYRELEEELNGFTPERLEFLGLINEEKTEVGLVHLGMVWEAVAGIDRPKPGAELGEMGWRSPGQLPEDELEYWSRLAMRL
ncbi:hypothetical protein HH1059_20580 [Halorhodospira halochloris]|uniref:Nudix hydrolase domain-containing protein n=1 Tax=Halorhodospira halochloris TaxID=1052 RepID=A0A125T2S8_HALHR|nr:NUDIX domain-containing protein [Halorhodospira halochloris]MBK1651893.1 hypothetical protein [Halorhodospira halochloris]BAU58765.1 hypothetical protein HH1059_20580 [Halorhodospira halochloris]